MSFKRVTKRLRTFYTPQRVHNNKFYFKIYPNNNITPRQLANAGFIYQGEGDTVRCAYCKVRVMDWVSTDDPIQIHKDVMPSCPFVIFVLNK